MSVGVEGRAGNPTDIIGGAVEVKGTGVIYYLSERSCSVPAAAISAWSIAPTASPQGIAVCQACNQVPMCQVADCCLVSKRASICPGLEPSGSGCSAHVDARNTVSRLQPASARSCWACLLGSSKCTHAQQAGHAPR